MCVGLQLTLTEKWDRSGRGMKLFRVSEGGMKALHGPGLKGYIEPVRGAIAWLEGNNPEFVKAMKNLSEEYPEILDLSSDLSVNYLDRTKWKTDKSPEGRRFAWEQNLYWYKGRVGRRPAIFPVPITGFAEWRYKPVTKVDRSTGEVKKSWKRSNLPPIPFQVEEKQVVIACTTAAFLSKGRPVWRLFTESLQDPIVKAATNHHRSPWLVTMDFKVGSLVA